MKKAIVVGATSGIGMELAIILADHNYKVGITGRRETLLAKPACHIRPNNFVISAFDVSHTDDVPQALQKLTDEIGGLDLLVLSSGTGLN